VVADQLREPPVAGAGQQDPDAPRVFLVAAPPHEAGGRAAVDQADGALVPHLEALGESGDGRAVGIEAAHEEQQLVLAGRQLCARAALSDSRRKRRRAYRNVARRS
jgi:hypothetical protein